MRVLFVQTGREPVEARRVGGSEHYGTCIECVLRHHAFSQTGETSIRTDGPGELSPTRAWVDGMLHELVLSAGVSTLVCKECGRNMGSLYTPVPHD
jgi:hypothetical protein